jgi:hypothetical protein
MTICDDNSSLACPGCSKPCSVPTCLREAAKHFLEEAQVAKWTQLQCLDCQGVEKHDAILEIICQDLHSAINISKDEYRRNQSRRDECKNLWHFISEFFCDAPNQGIYLSEEFEESMVSLTPFQLENN